jgi:hypothetical protein
MRPDAHSPHFATVSGQTEHAKKIDVRLSKSRVSFEAPMFDFLLVRTLSPQIRTKRAVYFDLADLVGFGDGVAAGGRCPSPQRP